MGSNVHENDKPDFDEAMKDDEIGNEGSRGEGNQAKD